MWLNRRRDPWAASRLHLGTLSSLTSSLAVRISIRDFEFLFPLGNRLLEDLVCCPDLGQTGSRWNHRSARPQDALGLLRQSLPRRAQHCPTVFQYRFPVFASFQTVIAF